MMDRTARIRAARPADAPALAGLCEELDHPSTEARVHDRLRLPADRERTLLVADGDGGPAGFVDARLRRAVANNPYGGIGGRRRVVPHASREDAGRRTVKGRRVDERPL